MDNSNNPLRMNNSDVAAVGQARPRLGVSSSIDTTITARPVAVDWPVSARFAFLSAEITGLLFVALTTFYIFVMPTSLTRGGRVGVMVNRIMKRMLDIAGSIVGLILCLPFYLIVPILIKLESRGPVFYSQIRIGINRRKSDRRFHQNTEQNGENRDRDRRREDYLGNVFWVYKFRTMQVDAEKSSGPVWATKADPRITRIGRFLRKTRIDETPQFLNVLKGDMSLVGPRPERPHFVMDLAGQIEGYTDRLQVKPGITGLAQIENGYDSSLASVARKVRTDLEYIENRSLWMDIKILVRTVVVVFTGKGAN